MAFLKWPNKDPEEILDYAIDWSERLASVSGDPDTIATSTFTITTGTVVVNETSNSDSVAVVWLEGGTAGENCVVQNLITTVGGRTMDQSVSIRIVDR